MFLYSCHLIKIVSYVRYDVFLRLMTRRYDSLNFHSWGKFLFVGGLILIFFLLLD